MHPFSRFAFVLLLTCTLSISSLFAKGFPRLLPKFPVGPTPAGVAVGDFNGDGKLDLVLVNQSGANSILTVALGRGTGGFRLPISTTVAVPAAADGPVFTGDFNGDHKLDIVFWGCDGFCVSLGKGDGTFGLTTGYSDPSNVPFGVGDLNGDGKLDVINPSHVFFGNGDGTFQTPATSLTGAPCVLADVNRDGKLDLIGDGVQLGNGDGTFQSPIAIAGIGYCPAVADFDGDGKLDLATAVALHGVAILSGNGDGTFQPPVYYRAGEDFPPGFVVGDFNGDGKPDLFLNYALLMGTILLNAGKGRFPAVANYQFSNFTELVVGDFNGDGRTDVVAVGFQDNSGEIALASPTGTLALPRGCFVRGGDAASVATGDFNGDGHADLAVYAQNMFGSPTAGVLNIFAGKGDGTFRTPLTSLTGGHGGVGNVVAVADFNHDGKLDLAFGSGDAISIRLGLGNGKFQSPVNYPAHGVTSITLGDFNGDGISDLAVNSSNYNDYRFPGQILLGNSDGTFHLGADLPTNIGSLVAGDFNNDGKPDLAISFRTGGVGIMLGTGDGAFQPVSVLRKGQGNSLVVADFNRDGNLDVAAVGGTPSFATFLSIYFGNGDGTLQVTKNKWIRAGAFPGGAATADFDGDGNTDLVITLTDGTIALLEGDGTGNFRPESFHPGGYGMGAPVVADVDGNGTPDLVFIDGHEATVSVLLNAP
jgi:VCBS repeat protein